MATRIQLNETEGSLTVVGKTFRTVIYSDGQNTRELLRLRGGAFAVPCTSCRSTGYLSHYAYIDNGMCYGCNGSGASTEYEDEAHALRAVKRYLGRIRYDAKKEAARRVEAEAAQAAYEARYDTFVADNAALVAGMLRCAPDSQLIADLVNDMNAHHVTPSDRQIEVVTDIIAKLAAAEESTRFYGSEGDKVTFTGVVANTGVSFTDYGTSYRVIVNGTGEFDGVVFKFFGTAAALVELQDGEGDEVTITATVKKHDTWNGSKQTVMLRPKLISRVRTEVEEPGAIGTLDVQFEGTEEIAVYPVEGTKHAHDLLLNLAQAYSVSYARLSFFDATWNVLAFSPEEIANAGRWNGKKINSLLDRNNTHYDGGEVNSNRPVAHWNYAQVNRMREWRVANGELQVHLEAKVARETCGCTRDGADWECPELAKLAEAVDEAIEKLAGAGLGAPWEAFQEA